MTSNKNQTIEGKNDFEDSVISVLKIGLASIGPEEVLLKEQTSFKVFTLSSVPKIYHFINNLKYNFDMLFFAKSLFNFTVIDKYSRYKKYSNKNYGNALCEKVIREVANRIIKREENICENLNKYLLSEDADFAFIYINESLKDNFSNYTVRC